MHAPRIRHTSPVQSFSSRKTSTAAGRGTAAAIEANETWYCVCVYVCAFSQILFDARVGRAALHGKLGADCIVAVVPVSSRHVEPHERHKEFYKYHELLILPATVMGPAAALDGVCWVSRTRAWKLMIISISSAAACRSPATTCRSNSAR